LSLCGFARKLFGELFSISLLAKSHGITPVSH
jgi:hypothetical protein